MKPEPHASDKKLRITFRGWMLLQLTLVLCLGLSLWGGMPRASHNVAAQSSTVIQSFTLDADPGWTTQGEWDFGQPTGGNGDHGRPDPTSGHTGNNVYGYNLYGGYANDIAEHSLTTTAIDCSGYVDVELRFWRWLNVERSAYDHATVQVSNDDIVWTTIWENNNTEVYDGASVADDAWRQLTYDISAIADGNSEVKVRWVMGPTDGGWTYSGWNIDDIEIVGTPVLERGVVHSFLLDTDPGWATQGEWAFGQPTGGNGDHGRPDPTSGHTGTNVYGYNLNGGYANNIAEHSLTTTALDCSTCAHAQLRFWRWLNVERSQYDHATVQVSGNGSDWTTIWENDNSDIYSGASVADEGWMLQILDISAIADGSPALYVRWVMGPTDGGWTYSGWNIDDVEIWGAGASTPTPAPPPTDTPVPTGTPPPTATPEVSPTPTPPEPCTLFEMGGQVVIEAEQYLSNVEQRDQGWRLDDSEAGYSLWGYMEALPDGGTNYGTYADVDDSPYLEYPVYFSTTGRYYVWVRGWSSSDSDDSIHAGVDGVVTNASDRISNFDYNQWDWSRTTMDFGSPAAYIDINEAGLYTFDLFMREDGFRVDKVILTNDNGFTPSGAGPDESFCCEPPPPPSTPGLPPGHRDCSQVLRQGNFETGAGESIKVSEGGYWYLGEESLAANQYYREKHDGNASLVLRCFTAPNYEVLHPWAYQQVTLPAEVITDTELTLTLWYYVEPKSAPRQEDVLYVKLRDAGGADITSDISIVNGASYYEDVWREYSVNLADGITDTASLAGQDIQLYFHAPNDGSGATGFYIDDARLDVCTTQPIPEIDPTKSTVGGDLRVLLEGRPTMMVGVTIWAYRTDGGECRPGENVCVTSSIHNSTYHFYNIEPGPYVIYAETWVGDLSYTTVEAVTVLEGDMMENVDLLLQ